VEAGVDRQSPVRHGPGTPLNQCRLHTKIKKHTVDKEWWGRYLVRSTGKIVISVVKFGISFRMFDCAFLYRQRYPTFSNVREPSFYNLRSTGQFR
jgi:hypothetical protein